MPAEVVHKSEFRLGTLGGLLLVVFVVGYLLGLRGTVSADTPAAPAPCPPAAVQTR